MNTARINEIVNMFDYAEKYTMDDIINIQVPSVYFPHKGSVAETLDEALKQGLLYYDPQTKLYMKA